MRYAIIADIHSNLAAFIAVLDDIERRGGVTKVWCLGDVVGYGPEPRECIALLRQTTDVCVVGNHDLAAIGRIDTYDFNPEAAAACHWTSQQLSADDIEYLGNLPQVLEMDDFTLVHGSPREPIWEYMVSAGTAQQNLAYFRTKYCLVGHSHQPVIFTCDETGTCHIQYFPEDSPLTLGESRLFINPGGVGQPRDGDPRASYAIYDSEEHRLSLHRVVYDIRSTQMKMQAHGLPVRLIARLSIGI